VRTSVINLLTDVMAYTDRINPSVKLFNGVVNMFSTSMKDRICR